MSVGKESIKRAANAGAKKSTETKEVKPAEAKTETVTPVKKTSATKTTTAKNTAAQKTTTRRKAAKTTKSVKNSVLTPANSEEIQAKFISDKAKQPEKALDSVHINEELPVYLL